MKWRAITACAIILMLLYAITYAMRPTSPSLSILQNNEPQDSWMRRGQNENEFVSIYVIESTLEDAISSIEKDSGVSARRYESFAAITLDQYTSVRLEQTKLPKMVFVTLISKSALTPVQKIKRALGFHN